MQLCPKIQDIGAKMSLYEFVSFISYDITRAGRAEQYYMTADFVPNITSLNMILYKFSKQVDMVIF